MSADNADLNKNAGASVTLWGFAYGHNYSINVEPCLHNERSIPEQGSTIGALRRLHCGQLTGLNG